MTDAAGPDAYGAHWADIYDDEHAFMDPTAAVELLAELAGNRNALELGVGTGRIALPLHQRSVAIRGVDASPAMVEQLRAKPGGDALEVVIADMTSADLGGPYGLIFVAFNTFFGLMTQERQIACFRNVATALEPGGRFVLECFVPDLTLYRDGEQALRVVRLDDSGVRLHVTVHDRQSQTVRTQVLLFREGGVEARPLSLRYCWPSELDLMARLAGLELADRWSGWAKQPFTSKSTEHVSIYQRLPD